MTLGTRKYTRETEVAMNKRADNKADFFCLLPEELVLSIFDKVSDLKSLCRCSLVSKHFAKVASGVRTVSIKIPDNGTTESFRNRKKLVSQLRDSTVEQIPELLDSLSFQHLKLAVFLQKFKELEFVYLEHEYSQNSDDFMFQLRKVKFGRSSGKLESFVGLDASLVHKDIEYEPDQPYDSDSDSESNYYYIRSTELFAFFLRCNRRYIEWMCTILILIKSLTSLQRVIISDSEMNMKLVIGDEQLVDIERRVFDEVVNQGSTHIFRTVSVPVLRLPLSGWVFSYVTLGVIDVPNPNASAMRLEETTFWDSEDKLKVLREAVNEILKKHRNRITSYNFDIDDVKFFG